MAVVSDFVFEVGVAMTTNPEVLRLARQCIVEALGCPNDEAWVDQLLKNVSADLIAITVLAIEKTSKLAKEAACNQVRIGLSNEDRVWNDASITLAESFRDYDHLRQSEKDNSDAD